MKQDLNDQDFDTPPHKWSLRRLRNEFRLNELRTLARIVRGSKTWIFAAPRDTVIEYIQTGRPDAWAREHYNAPPVYEGLRHEYRALIT